MAIGVVVGRKLRLDVRQRNVPAYADVHALRHLRNVEIEVRHGNVEAILFVRSQKLVAENALGGGEAIIQAVNRRKAETPVDMIGLHGVRLALDVQDLLIHLDGISTLGVGRREVRIAAPL